MPCYFLKPKINALLKELRFVKQREIEQELEVKILNNVYRKSSAKVKDGVFKYGVSRGWMTLKIREWKKDKLVQIKNKPLTLFPSIIFVLFLSTKLAATLLVWLSI